MFLSRWREYTEERLIQRDKARHAFNILRCGLKARVFYALRDMVGQKAQEMARVNRAVRHWANRSLAGAWEGWCAYVYWRRQKKQALLMMKNNLLSKAFRTWYDGVDEEQRIRVSHWGRDCLYGISFEVWGSTARRAGCPTG